MTDREGHDVLGRLRDFGSALGVAANIANPLAGPPPCVDVPSDVAPTAIRREVDPQECPPLVDLGQDPVEQYADSAELRLESEAAERAEQLEAATAFESAMDAVPMEDIGPDGPGPDIGGAPLA
jgi:hypothetical protein